uniref:RLR CTR domain-containing protein n=1 Tax=Strongyloides stercoralis TaxID=6248 RepID=A0AAF5HX78_STRER
MAFEGDFIIDLNNLPLSHFYTYKYEIIEYFMVPNADKWLKEFLSKAKTEHDASKIFEICTKGRFNTCKMYYEYFSPHYDEQFIIDALEVLPDTIKERALLKNIPQCSLPLYSQLFSKKYDERLFEKILSCTKWYDIYEKFNMIPKYQSFCEKIKKQLDMYPGFTDYLGCVFLRELPYVDYFNNIEENWYYDLRVAYAESDLNRSILMEFNPNFILFMKGIKIKREMDEANKKRILGNSLHNKSVELPEVPEKIRYQNEYMNYLPNSSKKAVGVLQPLKSYQLELVSSVDKDTDNHIAWIPKKAGKNSIISHIAINNFQLYCKEKKLTRMLILVPHFKYVYNFKNHLRGLCSHLLNIEGVGDFENNFNNINGIMAHDLVIMSGQMFYDLLKVNNSSYRLYFQDFSLIFFDRCEEAIETHAYYSIMKLYNENKYNKPKLIGITEYLGKHFENNEESSMDKLADLCHTFRCNKIDIVKDNIEDFYKDVPKGFQEIVLCLSTPNYFNQMIIRESYTIEKAINKYLCELTGDKNYEEHKFPSIEESDTYEAYLNNIIQTIQQQPDENIKKTLLSAINFLSCLVFTFSLHSVITMEYPLEHCITKLRHLIQNCDENLLLSKVLLRSHNRILKIHSDTSYEKAREERSFPLLRLGHFIKQSIKKNAKSKILIRVNNEILALALDRWLTNNDFRKKHNCSHTYVINLSDYHPESEDQVTFYQERMKKFKDGKVNILITTDISQEDINLNIVDCFISYNCPVTYNKPTGDFKAIDGYPKNMVLIVSEGLLQLDDQKRFEKDRMINCVVRRLRRTTDDQFKCFIEERVRINEIINKNHLEIMKEISNNVQNTEYEIKCSSCMTYLCLSKDIGIFDKISNVIVNPNIWSKVIYVTDKHYKYTRTIMRVGLVYCKACKGQSSGEINENNALGIIIKIRQGFFIKLIAKDVIFIDTVTKKEHYKKEWNAIENNLFLANEISEENYLKYCHETMCCDPEMHLLFTKKMSNYINICRSSVIHKDL